MTTSRRLLEGTVLIAFLFAWLLADCPPLTRRRQRGRPVE